MKASRICRRALVLAIAGLTVGVTACSSGSSATTGGSASGGASGAPELSTITIGAVLSADTVTLQIAKDKGFFKQQGLNVKIVPEASTNATAAGLLSHTMDFGDQNYIGMLNAAEDGSRPEPAGRGRRHAGLDGQRRPDRG